MKTYLWMFSAEKYIIFEKIIAKIILESNDGITKNFQRNNIENNAYKFLFITVSVVENVWRNILFQLE